LKHFALVYLPRGGIYLSGGVMNYLAAHFEENKAHFTKTFLDYPQMEQTLQEIPIFVFPTNPTLDSLIQKKV